ncbi:MAG TPA: PEP-CTERM sorting domain-containing protein [Verrucomicrobiae bacterium]
MNNKIILIITTLSTFVLPMAKGQGIILPDSTLYLSNLTNSIDGRISFGSNQWLAQPFETGPAAEGYILDLFQMGGVGVPGFIGSIYSNANGIPGNNLGDTGITLSPSATYWIVITSTSLSFSTSDYWNYSNNLNYYSVDNWLIDANFASSSDGVNWTSSNAHPSFQIEIEGTPVPEPSTWVFLVTGMALFISFRRRCFEFASPSPHPECHRQGNRIKQIHPTILAFP